MTQYDAALIDTIKTMADANMTPAAMMKTGDIDVPLKTVMAVIRDASEHGWANIVAADNGLDDDDDDEEELVDEDDEEGDEDRPHDFGTVEMETDDVPDVAEAQAEEVEKAKAGKRRKPVKAVARGKKPANTTNNKTLNRARRRRKGGNPLEGRRRLLANMEKLNPDFTHRWVLDRPGRIREMTVQDDWEIVTDAHIMEGQGGNVTAVAGTNHYNAGNMVMLRKPKWMDQEDQQEKLAHTMELENQIVKGAGGGQQSVNELGPEKLLEQLKNGGADHSNTYVPKGEKITVGRVSEQP